MLEPKNMGALPFLSFHGLLGVAHSLLKIVGHEWLGQASFIDHMLIIPCSMNLLSPLLIDLVNHSVACFRKLWIEGMIKSFQFSFVMHYLYVYFVDLRSCTFLCINNKNALPMRHKIFWLLFQMERKIESYNNWKIVHWYLTSLWEQFLFVYIFYLDLQAHWLWHIMVSIVRLQSVSAMLVVAACHLI